MTTFLTGKMSGKDVEGKFRERTPGKQKTWPEAAVNSSNKNNRRKKKIKSNLTQKKFQY